MKYVSITRSLALSALLVANSSVLAASWQDQLASAAHEISHSASSSSTANGQQGLALSSLTGLLNGGDTALSTNSMSNAAGILGYCMKQKLVSATDTTHIKNQLLTKLNLNPSQPPKKQPQDYLQGLEGLLYTGKGEQLNLQTLGDNPLAKQVKTKACDLVLKQSASFLP